MPRCAPGYPGLPVSDLPTVTRVAANLLAYAGVTCLYVA